MFNWIGYHERRNKLNRITLLNENTDHLELGFIRVFIASILHKTAVETHLICIWQYR